MNEVLLRRLRENLRHSHGAELGARESERHMEEASNEVNFLRRSRQLAHARARAANVPVRSGSVR